MFVSPSQNLVITLALHTWPLHLLPGQTVEVQVGILASLPSAGESTEILNSSSSALLLKLFVAPLSIKIITDLLKMVSCTLIVGGWANPTMDLSDTQSVNNVAFSRSDSSKVY